MRVSQTALMNQVLSDLATVDRRRLQVHRQLSSGRRINAPSDDPVGAVTALRYRTEIAVAERYKANAADGKDWLAATESALQKATEVLQRARELAVQGANGTLSADSYQALAAEVKQLREQLITIGNSSLGDRYLFGGQKTTAPPYDANGNYSGGWSFTRTSPLNEADLWREVGPGVRLAINVTGDEVFGYGDATTWTSQGAMKVLDQLRQHLEAGNAAAIGSDIGKLDKELDRILAVRADVGARQARLEMAEQRLQDVILGLQELQSKVEDVDLAEVATRLAVQENAYRVALAATARIVQPTLLDFLR